MPLSRQIFICAEQTQQQFDGVSGSDLTRSCIYSNEEAPWVLPRVTENTDEVSVIS